VADINRAFTARKGISLGDDAIGIFSGTLDPIANSEVAPIGSLYLREGDGQVYRKFGAANNQWTKVSALSNVTATTDPTITDDSDDGYSVGSFWINTTADSFWVLTDETVGAAVWISLSIKAYAETLASVNWVLISGSDYYQVITHSLNSEDLLVRIFDDATKKEIEVNEVFSTDANNLRIETKGNTQTLRVVISQGSGGTGGGGGANKYPFTVKTSGGDFNWTGVAPNLSVTIPQATHGMTVTNGYEYHININILVGSDYEPYSPVIKRNASGDLTIESTVYVDLYGTLLGT
jgi:hypothetical protein